MVSPTKMPERLRVVGCLTGLEQSNRVRITLTSYLKRNGLPPAASTPERGFVVSGLLTLHIRFHFRSQRQCGCRVRVNVAIAPEHHQFFTDEPITAYNGHSAAEEPDGLCQTNVRRPCGTYTRPALL